MTTNAEYGMPEQMAHLMNLKRSHARGYYFKGHGENRPRQYHTSTPGLRNLRLCCDCKRASSRDSRAALQNLELAPLGVDLNKVDALEVRCVILERLHNNLLRPTVVHA